MVPDESALITVSGEQRGRLPKWGRARDSDTEETCYAPMCTMVEDDNYGVDSDETGRYVELGFTAEVPQVVLYEQLHMMIDTDQVTTMRVYVTTAAKRAVVVKENDLPAKADIQANLE
eukprot:2656092-Pyramimonas_sp.AAC.1